MRLTEVHHIFESKCLRLIGLDICKVAYTRADNTLNHPRLFYKTAFPGVDTVDFAVTIFTIYGTGIDIYWNDKINSYGLGIKINTGTFQKGQKQWNVSKEPMWKGCIGKKITDVKVHWAQKKLQYTKSNMLNSNIYPQTLTLTLANGKKMFIIAAEPKLKNNIEVDFVKNNLLVTTNESFTKKMQMLIEHA